MEELIVGIVLALFLGLLLGYKWRDRISQRRRDQSREERFLRGQREALMQERERRSRHYIPNVSEAVKEIVEIEEA
jgi:hypothetical protein